MLHATMVRYDTVLHALVPFTEMQEFLHQILVHENELARVGAAVVQVARDRFEALVVAEDLRRGRRRHRGDQERVARSEAHEVLPQGFPVVLPARHYTPQVELELIFA